MLGVSAASCAILLCLTWSPEKTLFTKPPDQETADYDALTPKVILRIQEKIWPLSMKTLWRVIISLPYDCSSFCSHFSHAPGCVRLPCYALLYNSLILFNKGLRLWHQLEDGSAPKLYTRPDMGLPGVGYLGTQATRVSLSWFPFFCSHLNLGICFICGQWRYK